MKTLVGLALAGALPAAADIEFTVHHVWTHHAAWRQAVANGFTAERPDVTIEFQAPRPTTTRG